MALIRDPPCELQKICVLTRTEFRASIWASKMYLPHPQWLRLLMRSKVVDILLLIYCLLVIPLFVGVL